MKRFRNPGSMPMVALLVSGAMCLVWLAAMFGITWGVTVQYVDEYERKSEYFCGGVAASSSLSEGSLPGSTESRIWQTLCYSNRIAYEASVSDGQIAYSSVQGTDWQTAVAFYDGDGNLLENSGDFIFFPYDTEAVWDAAKADSPENSCGYAKTDINLAALSESDRELFAENAKWLLADAFRAVRFTGTLDGVEFHADKIEYVLEDEFNHALYSREPDEHYFEEDGTEVTGYTYSVSEVIRTENVPWHTLYDSGSQTPGAVTLYTTRPTLSNYEEGEALTFRDQTYDSLLSLLLSYGAQENLSQYSTQGVTDMVALERGKVYDSAGNLQYIVTTAVRCSPLRRAMGDLKGVYFATFLLTAALAVWVCLTIRRRLILPLEQVNGEIANDFTRTPPEEVGWNEWREVQKLYENYVNLQDRLRMNKNQITRLNTALDYAKTAEQNRRQMTSNIAHELKTPLAVIHSYAEGLKEHIAEGKREKYVDVILTESERLDNMVLELLDLSRLEAGRVKLARDTFSLPALTQTVFERLEMTAKAKNLVVTFDFPDSCTVNADEARIRQVVENFATNAVKYTPENGSIRVRITQSDSGTTFSVENDCQPLSDEALSKVWDTFYRADSARTGTGTGLGLAIAKNIIELHGGKCFVRNTETGVVFQFTI